MNEFCASVVCQKLIRIKISHKMETKQLLELGLSSPKKVKVNSSASKGELFLANIQTYWGILRKPSRQMGRK